MDDKTFTDLELQDAIGDLHAIDAASTLWNLSTYDFVRDWRVAGVLMEKVVTSDAPYTMSVAMQPSRQFIAWFRGEGVGEQESLPRAIIEACVEALCE